MSTQSNRNTRPFAEYFRDFYGYTAASPVRHNGRSLLTMRLPNGDLYKRKVYTSYRSAKIALGKMTEGTARLTGRKEC